MVTAGAGQRRGGLGVGVAQLLGVEVVPATAGAPRVSARMARSSPIGLCGAAGSQCPTPIQSRISWLTSRDVQPWHAGPASTRAQVVTL